MTTAVPRPLILVVDGSPAVRGILREAARLRGFDVVEAESCEGALEAVRSHRPDVALLAVTSCGESDLQTLRDIRDEDPALVVVLLVPSERREEIERGLDMGAVNFLTKPLDPAEVAFVLNELFVAIEDEADLRQVMDLVARRSTRLSFPGTPTHLSRVVAFLGREVRNAYPGLRVPVAEIKLALYEALANAIEHGNLGIDFQLKTEALTRREGFEPLLRQRLSDPELGRRRIHVEVDYVPDRVVYRVRDEGEGFRPKQFTDRTTLVDTSALHGRGLALIHHYMDRVWWNPRGNEIRMMRRILVKPARPKVRRGQASAE